MPHIGRGPNLAQRLAHKQDAIDEQTVCRALDFKVSEEGVCAEEREDLIEGIVAVGLGLGRLVGGQRRVRQREGVGRAAGLCAQREEGEVANEAWWVGVGVVDGVVGLDIGGERRVNRTVSCRIDRELPPEEVQRR